MTGPPPAAEPVSIVTDKEPCDLVKRQALPLIAIPAENVAC